MRRRFSKASALIEKARSDFAMAESYLKSMDYAAASAAYLSVIKEVLCALSKGKDAGRGITDKIEEEVLIPEYVADEAEHSYATHFSAKQELEAADKVSASSTIEKRDAAKRLIDYAFAYVLRG